MNPIHHSYIVYFNICNEILEVLLTNRLMGFDLTQIGEVKLKEILVKHGLQYDAFLLNAIGDTLESWYCYGSPDTHQYVEYSLRKPLYEAAFQLLTQILGINLGVEYSKSVDDVILLNQSALDKIEMTLTPDSFQLFWSKYNIKAVKDESNIINICKLIDDSVKVRFFANLHQLVALRLKTLPKYMKSTYIMFLYSGISTKHPELDSKWMFEFFSPMFPTRQEFMDTLHIKTTKSDKTCQNCILDMLLALEVSFVDNDISMTDAARLDLVFAGSSLSFVECHKKVHLDDLKKQEN